MKLITAKISWIVSGLTAFGVYALEVSSDQTIGRLPDWMKPLYGHGLLASLDAGGEVPGVTAGGIMTDELLAKLRTLPRLRELDIEITKDVTPAGLKHLAELRTLDLINFDLPGGGYMRLKELTQLHALSLFMCNVKDEEVDALEEALPRTAVTSSGGGLAHLSKQRRNTSISTNVLVTPERR